MWATFNRFEIQITKAQAAQGSHQGQCANDVSDLMRVPKIRRQLDALDVDALRAELEEYGCWNDEELSSDEDNRMRILWIACGNINDGR